MSPPGWPVRSCPTAWSDSIPGQDAVDELLHRRHEAVGIKGIVPEAEGGMAGEHQILLDRPAMGDVLQRLLDAEAPGIGEAAGRVLLVIGPGREGALAEAAHAIG